MKGEERTFSTQCASLSLLAHSGERNNLKGAVARKAIKEIRSYCQSADLKGSAAAPSLLRLPQQAAGAHYWRRRAPNRRRRPRRGPRWWWARRRRGGQPRRCKQRLARRVCPPSLAVAVVVLSGLTGGQRFLGWAGLAAHCHVGASIGGADKAYDEPRAGVSPGGAGGCNAQCRAGGQGEVVRRQ